MVDIIEIPKESLVPSEDNPRFDYGDIDPLVSSIRERIKRGLRPLIHPLIISDKQNSDSKFEVKIGKRRLEAARQVLEANYLQCIHEGELAGSESTIQILEENLCRKDLSPLEEALGFRSLRDKGLTEEEIGNRVHRSQSYVSKRVQVLEMMENLKKIFASEYSIPYVVSSTGIPKIDRMILTIEKAHELVSLEPDEQIELINKITKTPKGMSRDEIREAKKTSKKVKGTLELYSAEHPEEGERLKEKILPQKFSKKALQVARSHLEIGRGNINRVRVRKEFPFERFKSKSEAEKYAKEHKGELLGLETTQIWVLKIVPDDAL